MVPNGWTLEPFGKLLISSNQGVNTTTECIEYSNSGYAAIRSNNVIEGGFDFSDEKFVDEQTFLRVSSRFKPNIGDVLYCNIGSNLGSACVNTFDQEFLITWNVFRAVPKNDFLSSEYCAYILNFKRLDLRRYATESTMPFISSKVLLQYKLLVPPLDEQVKIVEILSTWDQAISATEKLLENSQQQKKALMQQLLTGKKRLLDENGVKFIKPWDICELKDIAQIIMGSSPKSEFYNDLGHGLPLIQGNADIKNRYSNPRIYTSEITKECINEDVLLSVRAPVGTVARSKHHACIGRGIAAIRAKLNVSQSFLYHLMIWKEPKWANFSQGSTFESINSDDIKSLKLLVPTLEEQKKIGRVLYLADQEIETLQKKLDCLKQEKKALMQQLLTGKKRVKVAA